MAKARRRHSSGADVMAPAPERWARGEVEALPQVIADESGRPAQPYRAIDTLMLLERRGRITPAMRQAGDEFRARFARAALDPLRAADLCRVPQGVRGNSGEERHTDARRRVWEALQALGGAASPAGSCIWHVVGCEWSLRQWALREGWGGRPLDLHTAGGVLIGALGVLQKHYGL